MTNAFRQDLPDLGEYRAGILAQGISFPLPAVPFRPGGLLSELPKPRNNARGWPWTVESAIPNSIGSDFPLISVVTPSFQQGKYLEETIRSVLLQNYPRLELIMMDGGSTDESLSVIETYRPWLSFARSASDRGQSHALNLGFAIANGDIRGWLNSDDFYLPSALFEVADAWKRTSAEILYGDSLALVESSNQIRYVVSQFVRDRYVKFPGLLPSHATFWHANAHQPFWEEQQCALDYELWIRLLRRRRISYVPAPLGVIREHDEAKSLSPQFKLQWEEDANRNGLAHPSLYTPRPLLDLEYRYVQGAVRHFRSRNARNRMDAIMRACAWDASVPGYRRYEPNS